MKTKTFLLLCFFLGIAFTQLTAQNGAVIYRETGVDYYIPVFNCDGEYIDWLTGTVTMHAVIKNQKDVWCNVRTHYDGVLTSENTDEVFTIKEVWKLDQLYPETIDWYGFGHYNLKGNKGTHYILNYKWAEPFDLESFTLISVKCPGNDK
jgi:hypothetical protein